MSPRVAKHIRNSDVDKMKTEAGMPPCVYLPYSSRHPRKFPLRLLSYREYARGDGGGNQEDDTHSHRSTGSKQADIDKLTKEKRLELVARRQFKLTYPNHKDDEERWKIERRFYQSLEVAPPPRRHRFGAGLGDHRSDDEISGKGGRKKKRPPTPGLPRKKFNRPVQRLHEVAQEFVTCRSAADEALLVQLDTIERERGMTLLRKKSGMTGDNVDIQVIRPDWNWRSEVKAMRLVADVAKLEEMVRHAKRHVWYMSMVKEITDNPNDPTKTQLYILNVIHRILSFGMSFDENCFLHLLSGLEKEEFVQKNIQEMLHSLRVHTRGVTLEMFCEWCSKLELGEPEEMTTMKEHLRKQQENKEIEMAAMKKKMTAHKNSKDMGSTLTALGHDR